MTIDAQPGALYLGTDAKDAPLLYEAGHLTTRSVTGGVIAGRSPGHIASWLDDNADIVALIRTVHTEGRSFEHSDFDGLARPQIARNLPTTPRRW